mmetsp:Transcript_21745/g.31222  ORF Transcript_21745/g.31222 Transcript_21745/m.31222 type:complete len:90 (+) Transcript_21745:292-561(+)
MERERNIHKQNNCSTRPPSLYSSVPSILLVVPQLDGDYSVHGTDLSVSTFPNSFLLQVTVFGLVFSPSFFCLCWNEISLFGIMMDQNKV